MELSWTADFFAGNRKKLRELFTGTAPIVLAAHSLLQKSADTAYPFTQDKNFWYLTGCTVPDAILVMDKDRDYIILPERSQYQNVFEGAVSNDLIKTTSGVDAVLEHKDGLKQLTNRLRRAKHVATIAPPPTYLDVYGMHTNPARRLLVKTMKAENAELELLDIRDHMARLRSIKQPIELEAIKAAIAVTGQALKTVTKPSQLARYAYEYEIEADLTRAFKKQGSIHSFDPIIAGGARACTLHNTDLSSKLAENELIQFDIGAEVDSYAADISRVYSIQSPTKRQQAVFAAVLDVQQYALSLLRPGAFLKEYEEAVEHYMGEKLRELNLIKTIEHDDIRKFYPHSASHFLGLDVHDVGLYEKPLEPGMVLTCEPGIYIEAESLGIRLEDDILITADGNENLSSHLAKTL